MNPIVGAIQANLVGNNNIPKPRFILEVTGFRIHDVLHEPAVSQELDLVGWGIISYTWGRFQDKTTYETSPNAPSFELLDAPGPNRIFWYIPKLRPPYFTMDDIRGVLQRLNMKYVWWDWACIPQYWDSGGAVDPRRNPQVIGYLPDAHKTINSEEVAKQFYIYTLAKKGVIWLHDIEWAAPLSVGASVIQKMLEGGQTGIPSTTKPRTLVDSVAAAKASVQLFQRMKLEDNWLSSMWTYQEGILLNTDDVVDPRNDHLLDTRSPSQFARLVDKKGNTYKADTCFRNEATLLDITGRATLLACDLAGLMIQAIQTNQAGVAADIQTSLNRLYETGLVGVAADSPLDVLQAAKARGVVTMSEIDYCVNAVLGALRVVLPDGTPEGRNDDERDERRRTMLSALVDRNGWKMVLLTKPTRGSWDPNFPNDVGAGLGDWLSILQRTWEFSSLGIFITSHVGRRAHPTRTLTQQQQQQAANTSNTSSSTPSGVGLAIPDNLSLTAPVPYSDNFLLMGAVRIRDHISLPILRHSRAVEEALSLPDSTSDAMVLGPEDPDAVMYNNPPAYGLFYYSPNTPKSPVQQGPAWTSCRFYASEKLQPGNTGMFPVKTARPFVKPVPFQSAFQPDTFGAAGPVVLLPFEDVSVWKGTVKEDGEPLERVVVLRCVVLTDFKTGPLRGTKWTVGGGIFLGIGDFTFAGSPTAVTVQSILGDGWMIYMY